jgi:EmrB/QacA subfamily drug resistance transporter
MPPIAVSADVLATEGHPQRWRILAVMCTSLVLVVASVSSLNVAIPSIAAALNPSQTEILWIIDAYALVFAGLLLPAGAIGDRYGRKGALVTGLAIFATAAVLASMADEPVALIALRGLMGVGAALIMPATLSIIVSVFAPHERAKAIATWAGFAGAGGALGSIASGLLLKWFWWGSVFFVNVPLALIAMGLILAIVPTSKDAERRPLDVVGAGLSIVGLSALVFGIIEGPEKGWTHGITLGAFAVAVVFLTGFVRWELGREHPMLDPRFFRIPRFGLGSLTITVSFLVMFGMFFLITVYFQSVRGDTPLAAAVRILPFPATMIAVAPRSPLIVHRLGGVRNTITLGLLLEAAGFAVFCTMGVDSPYLVAVVGMVLMAMGMAMLNPPATNAILSSLPMHKAGVGSAVNDTTREVGGALGIALMGSLVAIGYRNGVADVTATLPPPAAEIAQDSIGGAFRVASQLDAATAGPLVDAARQAQVDGQLYAFGAAIAIGLVTAVVVRLLWPADDRAPVRADA